MHPDHMHRFVNRLCPMNLSGALKRSIAGALTHARYRCMSLEFKVNRRGTRDGSSVLRQMLSCKEIDAEIATSLLHKIQNTVALRCRLRSAAFFTKA